jgi:hypothetical protein
MSVPSSGGPDRNWCNGRWWLWFTGRAADAGLYLSQADSTHAYPSSPRRIFVRGYDAGSTERAFLSKLLRWALNFGVGARVIHLVRDIAAAQEISVVTLNAQPCR